MRKRRGLALVLLFAAIGLALAVTTPVHSQRRPAQETLVQRLARTAKLKEDDMTQVLNALGPAVQEELRKGKQVNFSGLGTFRVVRIPEHRDMQNGRPVTVAGTNSVEFVPDGGLVAAANSEGAQPAETVPPFRYIPLPDRTPGQKMGRTRVPPVRTPPVP